MTLSARASSIETPHEPRDVAFSPARAGFKIASSALGPNGPRLAGNPKGTSVLRTQTCGQLRASDVGQTATLCGWVDSFRDHKGVLFVDLRDRYGKTQVVVGPDSGAENQELARAAQRVRDSGHRQGGRPSPRGEP